MGAYYAGFVPDDGQVAVYIPDLPGCITWGDDIQRAFASAIEAVSLHLVGMFEAGETIPKPSGASEALAKIRAKHEAEGFGPLPDETQLLLVPAPELEARPRKIVVSFRKPALDMIDRKAAAVGMTRSGFLARAAEAYQVETA